MASKLTIRYPRHGDPVIVDAKPAPVRRRYKDTRAFKIYRALERGGDLQKIAARFGVQPSVLRQHIKVREKTGRWVFDVSEWRTVKRWGTIAVAGKLRRAPDGGPLPEVSQVADAEIVGEVRRDESCEAGHPVRRLLRPRSRRGRIERGCLLA